MKNAESAQNFNWSHNLTIFQQWNEHQCNDVTQTQIYSLGHFQSVKKSRDTDLKTI